jgi:hypothetical protein
MRRHYRNTWSGAAGRVLAAAHTRAPMIRWGLLLALAVTWLTAGFIGWYGGTYVEDGQTYQIGVLDAVYRTIGALSMADIYVPARKNALNVARFAGLAIPLIGILFAFWGQLGRSLAQGLHGAAARHIVIAGAGAEAVHLANDCREAHDSVVLIAAGLPEDQSWALRKAGVFVIEGAASDHATLRAARAAHAAHVVAFETDDTANLQIEAAMRTFLVDRKPSQPIAVHVGTHSAMLLREAREMRSMEARKRNAKERVKVDPKPFSLAEIAARQLVQTEAPVLLDLAAQLKQPRVHLVFFGFDETAQAVAARVLMSLWSAHFEAPRLTVLARDETDCAARFRASHAEALAHPQLWTADIAFLRFDWERERIDGALLARIEGERGAPTGVVVSAGDDPENIRVALTLKRAANQSGIWPAPIYMKETARSEFSALYAKGDETEELDAYLQAFGSFQRTATRETIVEGALDRGAAIAHAQYMSGIAGKQAMSMRDLQAATKEWADVLETYRDANRAVSDAALVRIWDAGWRAADKKEKGNTSPAMSDEMLSRAAQREHDRWVAERLMAGWKPGQKRDNALMVHDKLIPWSSLSDDERKKDAEQVRASVDIARLLHPDGFVARS